MLSILRDTKISIQALKSADDEALTGAGVDMQGYDSVIFIAGALEGNVGSPTMKAQQDSASNFGTAADLLGTSVTFTTAADAKGLVGLEIVQPAERYVRPILTIPNWNAVPVFCLAIQFNAKDQPYATNAGELHVTPAEGTA